MQSSNRRRTLGASLCSLFFLGGGLRWSSRWLRELLSSGHRMPVDDSHLTPPVGRDCLPERQAGGEDAADLPRLLLDYFEGMADKAICASNVGIYLPCLTGPEADSLSAGVGHGVDGEDVRKTISRLWIQIGLGRLAADAAELVRAYCGSAVQRPVGSGRQIGGSSRLQRGLLAWCCQPWAGNT